MDNSRRSYVEDRSQKEDTGVEHRQNIETDRRGYPPKGIQSRPVPRFASLIQFNQFNGQEAPPTGGLSFTLAKSPNLRLSADLLVGRPRTWPFVTRQFSFFSGRPLKAFIAFTVIAASLFNPLQTSVATVRFVSAVLVETGLHSSLPGGTHPRTWVTPRWEIPRCRSQLVWARQKAWPLSLSAAVQLEPGALSKASVRLLHPLRTVPCGNRSTSCHRACPLPWQHCTSHCTLA